MSLTGSIILLLQLLNILRIFTIPYSFYFTIFVLIFLITNCYYLTKKEEKYEITDKIINLCLIIFCSILIPILNNRIININLMSLVLVISLIFLGLFNSYKKLIMLCGLLLTSLIKFIKYPSI